MTHSADPGPWTRLRTPTLRSLAAAGVFALVSLVDLVLLDGELPHPYAAWSAGLLAACVGLSAGPLWAAAHWLRDRPRSRWVILSGLTLVAIQVADLWTRYALGIAWEGLTPWASMSNALGYLPWNLPASHFWLLRLAGVAALGLVVQTAAGRRGRVGLVRGAVALGLAHLLHGALGGVPHSWGPALAIAAWLGLPLIDAWLLAPGRQPGDLGLPAPA